MEQTLKSVSQQEKQTPDIQQKLGEVREWAKERIKQGDVPPWTHFHCMKLNEALCQILEGVDDDSITSAELEDSPGSAKLRDDAHLQ